MKSHWKVFMTWPHDSTAVTAHARMWNLTTTNCQQRRAFTLLELLLSLAMTVVLLGVIFTALDLHWKFSMSGQEEVTRSQIARAVFNRMSHDIRSAIYRPKPKSTSGSADSSSGNPDTTGATTPQNSQQPGNSPTGFSSGNQTSQNANSSSSSGSTSQSPQTATQPMALTDAYSGTALGVFGDSETLVMHVLRPERRSRGAADVAGNPYSSSDLKSVTYYLGGSTSMMSIMLAGATSAPSAGGAGSGLTRTSADRLSLSVAGASADLVSSASRTEVLAPEIDTISFSYFDGVEWLTSWDSEVEGRLPNAIGISIGLRSPDDTVGSFTRRQASSMTDNYRIVVTLPAANSFGGMSY